MTVVNETVPVDAAAPSIVTAPVVWIWFALKSPEVPVETTIAPDAVTLDMSIAPPKLRHPK